MILPLLFAAFRLVLDPGHGGTDEGIRRDQLLEKHLVLAVAKQVESLLAPRGDTIVEFTRSDDHDVRFNDRRATANRRSDGAYVSIHFAGSPGHPARGVRIFLLAPRPTPQASGPILPIENVHSTLFPVSNALAESLRAELDSPEHPAEIQVVSLSLAPLLGIALPAALVELDDLTDPDAANRWGGSEKVEEFARRIIAGIDRFQSSGKNPPP